MIFVIHTLFIWDNWVVWPGLPEGDWGGVESKVICLHQGAWSSILYPGPTKRQKIIY